MNDASKFEALVPAYKMPLCPLCGKPICVPVNRDEDRLMVFNAHGMAALAHDGCHPDHRNAGQSSDG